LPDDYKKELIAYRIARAYECIKDTDNDLKDDRLYSAANRLYYAIFNTMRALIASDNVDFSKHTGVISYVRAKYVKTGVIDAKFSRLIRDAEALRNDCDYSDFYSPEKDELEKQLEIAKEFLSCIDEVIKNK